MRANQRVALAAVHQVARIRLTAHVGGELLDRVDAASHERDPRPSLRELTGQFLPDTARRSGDNDTLALQVHAITPRN